METKLERNIEREIKRGGSYDSRGRIVIIKVVYYVIIFKCKTEMYSVYTTQIRMIYSSMFHKSFN